MESTTEYLKSLLREEHRIKHGCDYALTVKYGEVHLLCQEVWLDTIQEVAGSLNITFTTIHTYGANPR
jgi:hypothetical protein